MVLRSVKKNDNSLSFFSEANRSVKKNDNSLSFFSEANRSVKIIILVIGLSLASGILEAEILTLDDFIKSTLNKNYDIRISREIVKKTQAASKEVWGKFFPQLSLSYTQSYIERPTILEVTIMGKDVLFDIGQKDIYDGRLSLRQPLFTAGVLKNSYLISKYAANIEVEKQRSLKLATISRLRKAYYNFLLMEEIVKITKQQKSHIDENLRITRKLFEAGKASNLDISRVKLHLVRMESSLIEMRLNLKVSRENLFSISGINDTDQEISGKLEYKTFNYEIEELLRLALTSRREIPIAQLTIDIMEKKKKLSISENLPKIYLVGNYIYERPYLDRDEWGDYWTVGGIVEFPFFDGLSIIGRSEKNGAAFEEAKLRYEQIKEIIVLQVKKSYYTLHSAKEKIKVQQENLNLAKENLKSSSERYARGLLSNLELNQAIFDYASGRLNLSVSICDYLSSIEDLKIATGKKLK